MFIAKHMKAKVSVEQEIIFYQGDMGDNLYLVV
jgi:CRP-like cAMP-binding protein